MHLPTEILLLIISEAEYTLPPLELFKARLVNSKWAILVKQNQLP
jgi:hypothetical protein